MENFHLGMERNAAQPATSLIALTTVIIPGFIHLCDALCDHTDSEN